MWILSVLLLPLLAPLHPSPSFLLTYFSFMLFKMYMWVSKDSPTETSMPRWSIKLTTATGPYFSTSPSICLLNAISYHLKNKKLVTHLRLTFPPPLLPLLPPHLTYRRRRDVNDGSGFQAFSFLLPKERDGTPYLHIRGEDVGISSFCHCNK